jgi:hypothetical protein
MGLALEPRQHSLQSWHTSYTLNMYVIMTRSILQQLTRSMCPLLRDNLQKLNSRMCRPEGPGALVECRGVPWLTQRCGKVVRCSSTNQNCPAR